MKQNANLFLHAQQGLPNLVYDLLLADGPYPFLFTCTSEDERETYLVVCHTSNAEKTEYIVAQCSPVDIQLMLKNEYTIRDALIRNHSHVFLVTYPRGELQPQVRYMALKDIPPEILPTPGYYMDAEDGEFDEELAILEKRVEENVAVRQTTTSSVDIRDISYSFLSDDPILSSRHFEKRKPINERLQFEY